MVTATAPKLAPRGGHFAPKYPGQFPPEQVVSLFRIWVVNITEISNLCGITKKLTFHIARHTFATTVTLSNDVPIETVSKMLGHTNIKTTQHYAKLLDTKVSNDMGRLHRKIVAPRQIWGCTAENNRNLLGVQICLPSLKTENTATVEAYG